MKRLEKKDTHQGFIFEVDLDYPESLWESHNDYPLAPDKMKVDKIEKLICSFLPKRHYVVHYKNLKQYLQEGMILKKVHRGITFYQSPWMEPYIRKNTDLRKSASNAFEKDFFKLINNSVFGTTIENIRKRQNVKIVDDKKMANKLSSKPNFERTTIFDENLIACHMKKQKCISINQSLLIMGILCFLCQNFFLIFFQNSHSLLSFRSLPLASLVRFVRSPLSLAIAHSLNSRSF